ncbi:hypothetical protein AB6D68_01350 [Vibrio cyclitrophicus]
MLSFEERLALLEQELSQTTAEHLFEELTSYEAKGPLAVDYLEEVTHMSLQKTTVKTVRVSSNIFSTKSGTSTQKVDVVDSFDTEHLSLAA